jgi:hypothetical protein
MKESNIERLIRLAGAKIKMVLWRNHRGFDHQKKVSYGLGPDGSSDEIGFMTVSITQEMVGHDIAVFSAIEVKKPGAKTDPERLKNQKNFIATVINRGGIGGFAESEDDLEKIVKKWKKRFDTVK